MSDTRTKAKLTMKMQAAIREQLPEEISAMLRQRLEQADDAIADNKVLAIEIDHLRERTDTARTLKAREDKVTVREDACDYRILEIDDRERGLIVKEMEFELNAERRISIAMQKTLMGLVRNTEYRKEMVGVSPDPSGQYPGQTTATSDSGTYTAE